MGRPVRVYAPATQMARCQSFTSQSTSGCCSAIQLSAAARSLLGSVRIHTLASRQQQSDEMELLTNCCLDSTQRSCRQELPSRKSVRLADGSTWDPAKSDARRTDGPRRKQISNSKPRHTTTVHPLQADVHAYRSDPVNEGPR